MSRYGCVVRVMIAPDSFTGTLSAVEAAGAMADGWLRRCPDDVIVQVPLSDGGPGFVDVIEASRGGRLIDVTVTGPLGEPVAAQFLLVDTTAYIESAQAVGLHLVPREQRDPGRTTSAGMGDLVRAAVDAGAERIIVGLGGSSVCDAGAGMLVRLGAIARNAAGDDVSNAMLGGGGAVGVVTTFDLEPARRLVDGVDLIVASDVDSPLLGARGAAHGFGAQKFADPSRVLPVELDALEQAVAAVSVAVGRRPDGRDPAVALGAGAAGGLGFALLALGGTRVPGIATVLEQVGLRDHIAAADVVVTGEGSFDWQSLRGKVVSGVAAAALEQGRPVVVLAGRVDVGRREYAAIGVSAAFGVVDRPLDVAQISGDSAAPINHAGLLADLAERAAGTWGGA